MTVLRNDKKERLDMKKTIFKFIIAHSKRQQITLLLMILASMPFLYAVLEMPKEIINDAIDGKSFPVELYGYELEQIEFLLTLCFTFLGLVLINGAFKYVISVYKGLLGERMLRRLRYELGSQVLRFPLPHFRKMSQGEIITMITAEVEPLGGFIGDAVAIPALEGGRMLTILIFMFMQDPYLGMAAIALYPLQMYLIPKLQKRVNILAKQRVVAVRKLSERLGEMIVGIVEVHAHDTSEFERADLSNNLGGIYKIRFEIYRKKFLIKFLNNFLAQMTPFLFYSIGGYLVIEGDLSFGALVAVLAAYKDLSDPWKDLLTYYQGMENAKIKYRQLIDQFRPSGMYASSLQGIGTEVSELLSKSMTGSFLTVEDDNGATLLDGATFQMKLGEKFCVLSPDGIGCSELLQVTARLLNPVAGTAKIGGKNIAKFHESITGRRLAYVGEGASLFSGSVRDNLLYGLKHEPRTSPDYDDEARKAQEYWACESRTAGNAAHDLGADWVDYEAAGVENQKQLSARIQDSLNIVNFQDELYSMGLQQTVDPKTKPDVADRILQARAYLHNALKAPDMQGLFEPFHLSHYNTNLSVAENLLFGTPLCDELKAGNLSTNAYVIEVLNQVGLYEKFIKIGAQLADIMVDMFQDIPPDHEFFRRFSFIQPDELPEYVHHVRCIDADGLNSLTDTDKAMLASLPFSLVTARHRLRLIDEDVQRDILKARELFSANLPNSLKNDVSFFDENGYNPLASIQDNLLFGKMIYGKPDAERKINDMVTEAVERFQLKPDILEAGLNTEVGIGGSRLSAAQRQKIAIARALLKRADLLILDSATSIMTPAQEIIIMNRIFDDVGERGLFWVLGNADLAKKFDKALVMKEGRIVEQGLIKDIDQSGSLYQTLTLTT